METDAEARNPSLPPGGRKLSVTIAHSRKLTKHDKGTQTIFRESEAQTVPWCPEVVCRRREDGTRITLDWSVPGSGSLGTDDMILIERARQRQAWEDTLPKTASAKNNLIRLSCIASIAVNEIAFREAALDAQREERLELSLENMKGSREKMLMKLKARLENLRLEKSEENSAIIKFWNRQFWRRMRKLKMSYFRFSGRPGRVGCESAISHGPDRLPDEMTATSSRDEVGLSRYLAEFNGIELLEKQISVSAQYGFAKSRAAPGRVNACSRTLKKAETQFEMLRTARRGKQATAAEEGTSQRGVSLRKRLRRSLAGMSPEELQERERLEEESQASLLLGKVIKGRALQTRFLTNLVEVKAPQRERTEVGRDPLPRALNF